MASIDQIETARAEAVRNIDLQVEEAQRRRDASRSEKTREKIDALVDDLLLTRTRLNAAAVEAQDSSAEMKEALKALDTATTRMLKVADHAKRLAQFLSLAAAFVTAGAKLATALET